MDCVPFILESWRETLQEAGHIFTYRNLQAYSGMDGAWMLERLLPTETHGAREKLLKSQGERYRNDFIERAQAFSAVHPLFESLKRHGIRIGIATTRNKDELAIYDRRMGILELVDAVACGDTVRRGKPDPGLLEHCRRSLHLPEPSRAVVIGDTPFDAFAAKAAGMRAVGGVDRWLRRSIPLGGRLPGDLR